MLELWHLPRSWQLAMKSRSGHWPRSTSWFGRSKSRWILRWMWRRSRRAKRRLQPWPWASTRWSCSLSLAILRCIGKWAMLISSTTCFRCSMLIGKSLGCVLRGGLVANIVTYKRLSEIYIVCSRKFWHHSKQKKTSLLGVSQSIYIPGRSDSFPTLCEIKRGMILPNGLRLVSVSHASPVMLTAWSRCWSTLVVAWYLFSLCLFFLTCMHP